MALNRGRHLCSAGRPSGWALAHILVGILSSLFFIVYYQRAFDESVDQEGSQSVIFIVFPSVLFAQQQLQAGRLACRQPAAIIPTAFFRSWPSPEYYCTVSLPVKQYIKLMWSCA